jgi:septin family protein
MPGWGDDINLMRYLRIVTSFLLEQRAKDYEKLAGSRNLGEAAMCGQLQHSVTTCLYFLPPHRVKKIDLILMAAISQLVSGRGGVCMWVWGGGGWGEVYGAASI